TPGPFTDLSAHSAIVRELPEPLPELCRVVPGLLVHPFLAHLYGLEPQRLRQDDLQIRSASEILDRVLAVDPRSLSEPRPPERRFVGNCRHFTVLLCALLRARGLPARARCGFGAYFAPPRARSASSCPGTAGVSCASATVRATRPSSRCSTALLRSRRLATNGTPRS